jgi:hypothetical protein
LQGPFRWREPRFLVTPTGRKSLAKDGWFRGA